MFLKPARPGLIVRDPISMLPLPEDGADKPESSYWVRRMADGDVVNASAPATEPEPVAAARPRAARSQSTD
jgi:hypothetical protein